MKIFYVLVGILSTGASPALAAPPDMTLDFTWIGTVLCAPRASSPEFQVGNMPAGTARLRFALTGPSGRELGGAEVQPPARGPVPKGAVAYRSPCVGGSYTWTVEAMDANGRLLASTSLARPFY